MNTSTRVEFGLYDVTARSDSAPVTEEMCIRDRCLAIPKRMPRAGLRL